MGPGEEGRGLQGKLCDKSCDPSTEWDSGLSQALCPEHRTLPGVDRLAGLIFPNLETGSSAPEKPGPSLMAGLSERSHRALGRREL